MPDEPIRETADQVANLQVRVYEIHEAIIDETSGLPGLRDAKMLHSADARPCATFEGRELYQTDFEKATALFHSLIKSHPFLDGTKRTAFAAALYYLHCSGYSIPKSLPIDEVVDFCVSTAEENLRHARGEKLNLRSNPEIAEWFRSLLK